MPQYYKSGRGIVPVSYTHLKSPKADDPQSRGTAASPALMAAARPTCSTRLRHAEGTPAPAAGNSRARQPLSDVYKRQS